MQPPSDAAPPPPPSLASVGLAVLFQARLARQTQSVQNIDRFAPNGSANVSPVSSPDVSPVSSPGGNFGWFRAEGISPDRRSTVAKSSVAMRLRMSQVQAQAQSFVSTHLPVEELTPEGLPPVIENVALYLSLAEVASKE